MVLLYMVTWIPSIYPSHVSIYTSTMDPSWNIHIHNTTCMALAVFSSPVHIAAAKCTEELLAEALHTWLRGRQGLCRVPANRWLGRSTWIFHTIRCNKFRSPSVGQVAIWSPESPYFGQPYHAKICQIPFMDLPTQGEGVDEFGWWRQGGLCLTGCSVEIVIKSLSWYRSRWLPMIQT